MMVSRCACQRQLKPPGGTTRSNVGVVESWWTRSCYILPNSGPRRRTLGLGKRAASKIVARPRRGKICSTLQRQSGGIWAGTSPGWGSPSSDVQGVAGCPTSRGGGGATAPPPHLPPPSERTGRILLAHSWLWCHRPPQVPVGCPTRCPLHPCPHQYQYPCRRPRPDADVAKVLGG